MIILGITNNDLAGACLVRDGGIVAAASEERFTRQKDHKAWPSRSIDYVLGEAGIDLADIDRIAYGWNAGFDAGRHLDLYLDRVLEEARERPEGLPHLRKRIADEMANDKAKRGEFDAFVRANGLRGKVEYIDHHECHALGAFVCSPFDEALTLTCDGRGDFQSLTVTHYRADGGETVLRIPQGLDPKAAAPLLCAGITSYSPLRHWKIGPGSRVAVVGLGGLGHMGLKFARALGAEVALFTRSPGKEEEARRLGADQVILSTDPQRMAAVAGRFDLILDTVPHQHDLNPYLATLKRDGTLVLVGLLEPLEPAVHGAQLVMGRRSIAGSAIGGIAETQEMLDFCATHGIACDIEMIEIQQINQAYERMLASDVKYRFVIDMASLQKSF